MAENQDTSIIATLPSHSLTEIKRLVWGSSLHEDVFHRWTQGFNFSEDESTALIQYEGGPCAVLAPVQAFILKNAVFNSEGEWRRVPPGTDKDLSGLLVLYCELLLDQCVQSLIPLTECACILSSTVINGFSYPDPILTRSATHLTSFTEALREEQTKCYLTSALRDILCQCSSNDFVIAVATPSEDGLNQSEISDIRKKSCENQTGRLAEEEFWKAEEVHFHANIRIATFENVERLEAFLRDKYEMLRNPYGVLLFLYSILLTKGVDQIKNEMEDPNEPLIDGIHGHGSQSLINLLLTGRAVSNVWDNDKNVSGLSLPGINKQPVVGFLTILEHLRYLEVGWFLKCPQFPIWVLGSETHLTVLFSKERTLCTPETPEAAAKRIFKSFDPEGNNFISSILLEDVLKALGLCSDEEYVEMMKKKLDEESLGIILLSAFMEEFFPNERSNLPESFIIYHYNGLKRSCPDQKVMYQEGQAVIMDFDLKVHELNSPILTCLQTKWPGLEVEWVNNFTPSIN